MRRDSVRREWLDNWQNHTGLARFHGHGGLKLGARAYVRALLAAEPEEVVIRLKKRGAGVGGWSKDNPYGLGW